MTMYETMQTEKVSQILNIYFNFLSWNYLNITSSTENPGAPVGFGYIACNDQIMILRSSFSFNFYACYF